MTEFAPGSLVRANVYSKRPILWAGYEVDELDRGPRVRMKLQPRLPELQHDDLAIVIARPAIMAENGELVVLVYVSGLQRLAFIWASDLELA